MMQYRFPQITFITKGPSGAIHITESYGGYLRDMTQVSWPANKFRYLFDLFEDGISGCYPDERSGTFIVMSNEFSDLGEEFFCAAKRVSPDRFFGDMLKPPLKQLEP
jgi:hypothetical protein